MSVEEQARQDREDVIRRLMRPVHYSVPVCPITLLGVRREPCGGGYRITRLKTKE